MPVTGPVAPGAQFGAAAQSASRTLATILGNAGLLAGGADPGVVARNLLSALKEKGFGAKAGKSLDAQLKEALSAFQRANGLNTSGGLDKATLSLLKNLRMIGFNPRASGGVLNVKDGFERAAPSQLKGQQQALARSDANSPVDRLRNVLELRLGVVGRALGGALAAAAEGLGRAGDAIRQGFEGMTNALSNLVGGARAGSEGAAQSQAQNQAPAARAEANPAAVTAHGLVASQSKTKDRSRARPTAARKRAKHRGLEVGAADADEGVGDDSGTEGLVGGGEHKGGGPEQHKPTDPYAVPEDEETEPFAGNAPSGDESFADGRRGHATLNDGTEAEAGHYQIPRFAEQVREAMLSIRKDPERPNQATTYSWDVRFYRPAVYGAHQKAEEILHLEVRSAGAFDPVWEKTLTALSRYLKRFDPKAKVPDLVDIQAALRRARVQDDG